MGNPRRRYAAYLLRLWQVDEAENSPWRASLESPPSSEIQVFAGLPELFSSLENSVHRSEEASSMPGEDNEGGQFRE